MIDGTNSETAKSSAKTDKNDSNEGFINHPHLREEGATLQIGELDGDSSLWKSASSLAHTGAEVVEHAQDMAHDVAGNLRGFASRITNRVSETSGAAVDSLRSVQASSRRIARKVDSHARTSPWIAISAVGASALVLGFVAGRLMTKAPAVAQGGYDFDQATDE